MSYMTAHQLSAIYNALEDYGMSIYEFLDLDQIALHTRKHNVMLIDEIVALANDPKNNSGPEIEHNDVLFVWEHKLR